MTAVLAPAKRTLGERLIRPTLPELWTFLAVALPVFAAIRAVLPTADLAFQLRAGSEILAGRGTFSTDSWTFTTAGLAWLDQQWGAQVILAAVFSMSGWFGLAILRAALVGAISGLILWAVRVQAPSMRQRTAALLTLAAFAVTTPALALRPQLFGMWFFAIFLLVLVSRRKHARWLWALPLLSVAWANTHGSFILAPALIGLAWLEDLHERSPRANRTLVAALASGAATLMTPFGIGAWKYALNLGVNREVRTRVIEWQPPTLSDGPGILFWTSVLLVAVALLAVAWRRRSLPWPAVLGLATFVGLGMLTVRGVAWWPGFAVVTLASFAIPLSRDGAARAGAHIRPGNRLNAVIASVLVLLSIAALPIWRPIDSGLDAPSGLLESAPSKVTSALRKIATPADRVWNPQVWGSWLEFAVPAPSYAFDSRIELIPSAVWADGDVVITAGAGWQEILDTAGATIVIAEGAPTAPLARALALSPEWTSTHTDADGSVWIRTDR